MPAPDSPAVCPRLKAGLGGVHVKLAQWSTPEGKETQNRVKGTPHHPVPGGGGLSLFLQSEVGQPETQPHLTRCMPTGALGVFRGCSCLPGTSPRLVSRAGPACTPTRLSTHLFFPSRNRHHGFIQGGAGGACTLGLSATGGQGLQCAPLYLPGEPRLGEVLPPGVFGCSSLWWMMGRV